MRRGLHTPVYHWYQYSAQKLSPWERHCSMCEKNVVPEAFCKTFTQRAIMKTSIKENVKKREIQGRKKLQHIKVWWCQSRNNLLTSDLCHGKWSNFFPYWTKHLIYNWPCRTLMSVYECMLDNAFECLFVYILIVYILICSISDTFLIKQLFLPRPTKAWTTQGVVIVCPGPVWYPFLWSHKPEGLPIRPHSNNLILEAEHATSG